MAIFNDEIKQKLKETLINMKDNVNMLFFTQEYECRLCKDTNELVKEFSELTEKLSLTIFDFQNDADKVEYYNVDKIPCVVLLDKDNNDTGIKFYGPPGGYEINSFITAIYEVSGVKETLPDEILNRIKKINKKIHIQVFVTLVCPYCPAAVLTAHRLALENKNIRADMVEASTFPHLANRYSVQGVPKIIINEKHELVGAQPIKAFLDTIDIV